MVLRCRAPRMNDLIPTNLPFSCIMFISLGFLHIFPFSNTFIEKFLQITDTGLFQGATKKGKGRYCTTTITISWYDQPLPYTQ
jgi:hypothetical protein